MKSIVYIAHYSLNTLKPSSADVLDIEFSRNVFILKIMERYKYSSDKYR